MTAAATTSEDDSDLAPSVERSTTSARHLGRVVAETYRLQRLIGSGGSSYVFEAEHLRLGSKIAVKILKDELGGKRAAQRFRREATAVARLRSDHVVRVLDCGELDDHVPYLVMELLEGEDLRRLLAHSAPLPVRRVLHLATEACRGLEEVHRAGLVHRDLKPENLFVTRRSSGEDCCKILDFGVAQMEASVSTAHGALIGTVRYMAPEQLADASDVSPATDIYAIGAILFECLTGRALIRGGTVQESMYRIMNVAPAELVGQPELIAEPLRQVVLACLDKSPARRPRSADELIRRLQEASRTALGPADLTLIEDDAPSSAAPRPNGAGTSPLQLAGGAFVTTLLGAFLGWQMVPRPAAVPPALVEPSASTASVPSTIAAREIAALPSPSPSAHASSEPVMSKPSSKPPAKAKDVAPKPTAAPALDAFDHHNPYGD